MGNFTHRLMTEHTETYESMLKAVEKEHQIVDTRLPMNFTGEATEPSECKYKFQSTRTKRM